MRRHTFYNTKEWSDRYIALDPIDASDRERVAAIIDAIPLDVETVLDVGTGGGYIRENLRHKKDVRCFGVDISFEMLKKSGARTVCAGDAGSLPFASASFDLVLANDVIEHIEKDFFPESIREMIRVSKKYILISSPYKDAIDWPVALCDKCGREFNVYGHMRSVDMKLIETLFPRGCFEIVRRGVFGKKRDPRPSLIAALAKRWGKVYSKETVICPHCLNTSIRYPERTALQRFFGNLILLWLYTADKLLPPPLKDGSQMYVVVRKKEKT